MAHVLHHLLADSVRFLALTSPIQAALIRELGAERATEIVHRVLDAMTPEERRSAVMASMAGQAQLAADIMRLDAGTGYDRCDRQLAGEHVPERAAVLWDRDAGAHARAVRCAPASARTGEVGPEAQALRAERHVMSRPGHQRLGRESPLEGGTKMENQHRHIKGYRDLSQDEIDLMNEIKSEGERLEALVNKVKANINPELQADTARNPNRWAAMAATDFQTGLMALVRAVAVPDSF